MGFASAQGLRPTLAQVRDRGDYATLFRWAFDLPTLPPAFAVRGYGVERETLDILCESTDLPTKTVDKMLIGLRGHKHYQPGIVTPASQITLNFLENVRNDVHRLLLGWQETIWEAGTGRSFQTNQLCIDDLPLIRLDNEDNPICVYHLVNVFLESYTFPRLDGSTSGPFNASAAFSYDDFWTELLVDNSLVAFGEPGAMGGAPTTG